MKKRLAHQHTPADAEPALELRLAGAIALNTLIVVVEVIGGMVSGSLALLSDAVHNLSDVIALIIALVARRLGRRPPSNRHTYGLGRVEVMAALFNSATILVVGTLIIHSAVARLMHPSPILSGVMLTVAVVGLAANLFSVLLLRGHSHGDMNMQAAMLHLLQDTLSSAAVVVAALLASWKYGPYLDPVVSMLVVALVLASGWRLLRDAIRVLLEGTPDGLDLKELQQDVQQLVPGCDLHHIHVWELRPNQRMLTAHLRVADERLSNLEPVLQQVRARLQTRWAISHSTLEPEIAGCGDTEVLGKHLPFNSNSFRATVGPNT
ncbi:MAG: cation diffusion facilitator family transporter [bacterium]